MNSGMFNQVFKAFSAFAVAMTIGTVGFWLLSEQNVSIGDCLYMTIITLSTVGYGEIIPLTETGRAFASFLIVFGMGTLIYFGSTVAALWVETDMGRARRKRKMRKDIENLNDHIIVCGVGTTGENVVRELLAAQIPFVMIENDEERIQTLAQEIAGSGQTPLYIIGDATEDRVLDDANIEKAAGLVAALRDDKENIYIILSARQKKSDLRIVARATERDAPQKMLHAGAHQVVSPNMIGGLRIASVMIRPQVVEFLDVMMRDLDQNTRIEQVVLPPGSALAGRKLSNTKIRQSTDVLVIAIRDKDGKYIYNPGPDAVLTEQATLVVLGQITSVRRLRKYVSGGEASSPLIES